MPTGHSQKRKPTPKMAKNMERCKASLVMWEMQMNCVAPFHILQIGKE
jgi:hypothetical protein